LWPIIVYLDLSIYQITGKSYSTKDRYKERIKKDIKIQALTSVKYFIG